MGKRILKLFAVVLSLIMIIGTIPINAASKKPSKPTITVKVSDVTKDYVKVTIKISKTANAKGYYIYQKMTGESQYTNVYTLNKSGTKEREYSIKYPHSNNKVSIKIKAFNGTKLGKYSSAKTINLSKYKYLETPTATQTPSPTPLLTITPSPTPSPTPQPTAIPSPTPTSIVEKKIAKGDIVTLGTYEQDNNTLNGKEPIEWIVLSVESDKALLLSKYALENSDYSEEYFRGITWETCSLRKWLNEDFYNSSFTSDEKSQIIASNNDNSSTGGSMYVGKTAYGGNNTIDNVFLLSLSEVSDTNLGFNSDLKAYDNARICLRTKYAIERGVGVYQDAIIEAFDDPENTGCMWWLRSLGDPDTVTFVRSKGEVSINGFYVDEYGIGVRPAIYISISP